MGNKRFRLSNRTDPLNPPGDFGFHLDTSCSNTILLGRIELPCCVGVSSGGRRKSLTVGRGCDALTIDLCTFDASPAEAKFEALGSNSGGPGDTLLWLKFDGTDADE